MAQPTDIVLDSAGYMIVPGKYTRAQDGMPEGRTGRIALTDFFGGMRRHIQLERDKSFDGLYVGPAMNGQGVKPWAYRTGGSAFTSTIKPNRYTRIPTAIVRDRVYFAIGSHVFACAIPAGSWATPASVLDATEDIEDMCLYSSDGFLLTFGDAKDVTWYRASDLAATVLLAGEKGHYITGYGGYAIWSDARTAGRPTFLRQVTGTQVDLRILDYDVVRMVNAGAKCYAITKSAIYSYSGRVHESTVRNPAYSGPEDTDPETIQVMEWSGDWSPYFQNGVAAEADDYKLFEGFGGRTYAWVAGEVMEDNPSGDRAGWRSTGLRGRTCLGGCVAGGYLIVSIITEDNRNQVWAWEGSGWWKIAERDSTATGNWIWPTNLAGTGGYDLLLFLEGTTDYDMVRLQSRGTVIQDLPTGKTATFTTPMIDVGERDKTKAWRKMGAVFASPELEGNTASTDVVNVALYSSIDAGATWQGSGITTLSGNTLANLNFTLDKALSNTESRFLMMQVRWTSINDWAPVLVGLWAEFEVMDSPSRRRKWTFDVVAADQTVDRDGVPLARTGRQLITELWSAWEGGTTIQLRDIDYDDVMVEREVRIVGISESVPKPSDQARWGDSIVSLQLVEV